MCGIVGIWAENYGKDGLRSDLEQAVGSLRHRGPDDSGIWLNDRGVALGHTRLSILDLSPLGHQPMVSPDGRYVITFNGEIYNFSEIRARLLRAGHSFSGSGDTEVILHAFREWGPEAVEQFIGMFAIAVWDEQEQSLELIRDRIGIKPLYYAWDGKSLCFGSELRALRAFRHWRPEIDRQSLGEFLQYGYVPDDRTIYRGVHKLRPGQRLRLSKGRQPLIESYWSVLDHIAEPVKGADEAIETEFESLLIDACRYRMVADVPVGLYLSGGVDSSLVTAVLAKHYGQRVRTYTIGFAEDTHDESSWARAVAEHCGTDHTEYVLGSREALDIAKRWGDLFDEPFADSSSIPTLLVSQLAGRDVKVVLSADGGDELFSGYTSYTWALKTLNRINRLPNWLRSGSQACFDRLAPTVAAASGWGKLGTGEWRGAYAKKLYRMRGMFDNPTPAGLIDVSMSHWYPEQIRRLLGQYEYPAPNEYPGDAACKISLRDFHHYLPGDILTKVDRATMAVGIEGREPLLDHRLAEFAFRLPPHLRRGTLGPKHLLKSVLYRYVPRELVDRPKMGFAIPKHAWLKGDLKPLVLDFLSPARIETAGIMNSRLVSQIVRDFYSGNSHLTEPLWFLLTFEMWRQRWT